MNNTSRKLKHKQPILSSLPPPVRETVHGECFTRKMTDEDWDKYGPRNEVTRKGNHYMHRQKKKGEPA